VWSRLNAILTRQPAQVLTRVTRRPGNVGLPYAVGAERFEDGRGLVLDGLLPAECCVADALDVDLWVYGHDLIVPQMLATPHCHTPLT
jgi:hypothetical protein